MPPSSDARAVAGHGEGDLIVGAHNRSASGTLVERSTRYVMLLYLPEGYAPSRMRDALAAKIATLPVPLRRSLIWDMHLHGQFTQATGMPVYFCDPHAPWQRAELDDRPGGPSTGTAQPNAWHSYSAPTTTSGIATTAKTAEGGLLSECQKRLLGGVPIR
jgi:hypothetical protein